MAYDTTQVVAGRNLIIYTEPWATANGYPADSVLWGTAWGTPWADKGFTKQGLHVRMAVQRTPVLVDQVVDPVLRIPTQRDLEMQTRLAQMSMANLSDATGQGSVSQSGASFYYVMSGTITDQFITTGFDILNPGDNKAIRVVAWKGFVNADVQLDFNVTDSAEIAFNVSVIPDTSVTPWRIAEFRDIN